MTGPCSVADAQALAIAQQAPGPIERVAVADAIDRILREEVSAARDVPGAPTSAMDGWAVRAGAAATLRLVEESAAGRASARALAPGEAAPISTGALLPAGADAVVPVEDATRAGAEIVVPATTAGAFVRARGSDLRQGEPLLSPGQAIDAAALALLCGEGLATVAVSRRPEVAILSTGAELRPVGAPLAPGELHDQNGPALAALVRQAGAIARAPLTVGDDLEATQAALAAARSADLVLVSGGVSVGAHDHVRPALAALGGELLLWRVAMKPGKPLVLARLGTTTIIGLPGNPVSAQVGALLFVRPVLRRMLGAEPALDAVPAEVALAGPLRTSTDRPTYLRARVHADGARLVARLAARQGSAALVSLRGCNALVRVDPGEHDLPAGAQLPALLYAPLVGP